MHSDYTKICRVCMSNGSRDIFVRPALESIDNPLERLLEKLRYITMMKIEESDDLPRLLCDLCIVQLNVAYNFKRQAIENDTKLRQYFIENGINTVHSAVVIPETPTVHSTIQITDSNIPKSFNSSTISSNSSSTAPEANIRIMPIIIKTEPLDNDNMFGVDSSSISSLTPTVSVGPSTTNINTNPMVCVNGYSYNSLIQNSNDIESSDQLVVSTSKRFKADNSKNIYPRINNNKNDSSNSNDSNSNAQKSPAIPISNQTLIASTRKKIAEKRLGGQLKTKRIMPEKISSKRKKSKAELENLSIDMKSKQAKMSRGDMKKTISYISLFKGNASSGAVNSPSNAKQLKKGNQKVNNKSTKVVLNPFNNNEKSNKRKVKKVATPSEPKDKTKLLKPKIEPEDKN